MQMTWNFDMVLEGQQLGVCHATRAQSLTGYSLVQYRGRQPICAGEPWRGGSRAPQSATSCRARRRCGKVSISENESDQSSAGCLGSDFTYIGSHIIASQASRRSRAASSNGTDIKSRRADRPMPNQGPNVGITLYWATSKWAVL